jgi:hypothetical protein
MTTDQTPLGGAGCTCAMAPVQLDSTLIVPFLPAVDRLDLTTTVLGPFPNQVGKTFAAAMELAAHITGIYPVWWQGYKFDRANRAWASGFAICLVLVTNAAKRCGNLNQRTYSRVLDLRCEGFSRAEIHFGPIIAAIRAAALTKS